MTTNSSYGTVDDELANARALLDDLSKSLKSDPGAAFSERVLGALGLVRDKDPAAYARVKSELQKAKVSIRDVEKQLANRFTRPIRWQPGAL